MTRTPFILSAFSMSTVSHGNFGMWRHPEDRTAQYTSLSYWVDLARLLDDGGFDLLFIADAVGQLDVFGGSAEAALTHAVQTPVTDPLLAVSAMAAATRRLGFGITVSTTYEIPTCWPGSSARWTISPAAGSAGTSSPRCSTAPLATSSAGSARSHTTSATPSPKNSSTLPTSCGKARGRTAPWCATVRPGGYSPMRPRCTRSVMRPVLQRARCASGRAVAAADSRALPSRIILSRTGIRGSQCRSRVRVRPASRGGAVAGGGCAAPCGRARPQPPDSVRFLSSVEIVVDSTPRAAQAKADELSRYTDLEGGLVLLSALSGVDWSTYGVDRPIEQFDTDASQSILATVDDSDGLRQRITLRDYVGRLGGFGGPLFVGDATTVADGLVDFAARTGGRRLQHRLSHHAGQLRRCRRVPHSGTAPPWTRGRGTRRTPCGSGCFPPVRRCCPTSTRAPLHGKESQRSDN